MKKQKSYLLKFIGCILILFCLGCSVMLLPSIQAAEKTRGMNVAYHTQEEIKEYLKGIDLDQKVKFSKEPQSTAPYEAGELDSQTQQNALDVLNACRYIAGLDANVTTNDNYVKLAQYAALVNAANNQLNHYPEKPNGMDEKMYQLGAEGAKSSNLAAASWQASIGSQIIHAWMDDSDSSNIDRVGHRRWILNPTMKQTGFGVAKGETWNYYTLYALDGTFQPTDCYGVAWPAQTMPLEFFKDSYAWSISIGKEVPKKGTKVTLIRQKDNKTWNFSSEEADGYFQVENSNYGQKGCIIFRPDEISYSADDEFSVTITGNGLDVAYQVHFFSLCDHPNTTVERTDEATCTKSGYTGDVVCTSCKKMLQTGSIIPPTGHSYVSKTENGYQVKACSVCGLEKSRTPIVTAKKPAATTISKIVPRSKGFTLSWKKKAGVTGYQVQYSTDKNFQNKVTKYVKNANSIKITKLKGNQQYYVRVRTYKTTKVDGELVRNYSSWTKISSVRTKK